MHYSLRELLDIPRLQALLESLNEMQRLSATIVASDGAILTATPWPALCARFHRVHPETGEICRACDKDVGRRFSEATPHLVYRCPLGLISTATPIVIAEELVGYVIAGQLFTEPPDEAYFINQARRYGFEEDDYLSAPQSVPLITAEQLRKNLDFIGKLSQMLADQGLQSLRQREATEALRKSEERYRTILQTAMNGICLIDLQGHLLEVNRAYCHLTGYSEQELITMGIADLEANETADAVVARIRRIMEAGDAQFDSRHRRKDGSVIDVEISIQFRPDDGSFIAFVRDITERKLAENMLWESRAKLEAALNSMTDAVCISDTAGHLVDFNDAFASFLRFANKAECPRTLTDYMEVLDLFQENGEPVPLDRWAIPRALRGETVANAEYTLVRKDTGERWVGSCSCSPVRDKDGAIVGSVLAGRDITERKRVEAYRNMGQDILRLLSEKETKQAALERVINLVRTETGVEAVGIRLQDGDDFPYFYQEGFPQEFLQKEYSLLARTRDGGICRDDCGNVCLECTCGMVITGKTDPSSPYFTSGGSCWTNDSLVAPHLSPEEDPRTNPRDECIHQGFASVALIPIRAKGRNVGLLQLNDHHTGCFSREVIETLENIAENIGEAMLRKQAEEKLIASERFLRGLTNQIPGMVGYWTSELRCSFANKAYLEWFGRTPEQMLGISIQELMGEELFRLNEPYMRKALQGEPQRFERTLTKPSGETGHTWAHYIPDLVDGTVQGFYVLVSDVTEIKRAEEEKNLLEAQLYQAQKIESIGRLAGGVAHDFNNMLSVILGHAEIALMRIEPDQPLYTAIKEISKAARHSADLTRQLLAFARKQTVSPKALDLNGVVAGMFAMLQRLIGENISLTWKPGTGLWQVMMDASQLDQIMANLCVNARDAIADIGEIIIETRNCSVDESYCLSHAEALPGDYVKVMVTDNGSGIDRETLAHIFEPFFTTKGIGEGTGLGLATVYGIVRQNGGFIDVSTTVGSGTTFSIHLPRHVGKAEESRDEPAVAAFHRGNETILLVEDEPSILEMTATIFTELGYTVLKSSSPNEAIRLAREQDGAIDLLITDVIMPEMNGRELARNIAAIAPRIKCLFMSGYTADIIANHGVLDADVHFIQKPFHMGALSTKLREVLEQP